MSWAAEIQIQHENQSLERKAFTSRVKPNNKIINKYSRTKFLDKFEILRG